MTLTVFAPPPGLTYPWKRSPVWSTLHQPAVSGKDNPIALWPYPRYRYELPFSVLRAGSLAELQYLMGFFNIVAGSAKAWLYTDPDDGSVAAQAFAISNGVLAQFGLVRTRGGFVEPVFAPVVDGTFKVFDNGVDITANVTVGTSGLVTINTGPPVVGHTISWTGSYNWIVRFDDDALEFVKMTAASAGGAGALWELQKMGFTTVPVTFA